MPGEFKAIDFDKFEQARGGILVTIPREKFIAIQTGKPIGAELSTTQDDQTSQKSVQKSVQKQQAIYNLIKNKGSLEPLNELLNTERIALLLDIPYSTAKRIVKDLEKKGLIVRVGSKKNGHWEILS